MTRITTLDLPQFHRATVGFNNLFADLERQFANSATNNTYPRFNVVELDENEWMVSLAVAGFGMDNLDITLNKNTLTVEGIIPKAEDELTYLHKGIATRSFRRSFTLADHIEVQNAHLELGMLNIHLVRHVPAELQPKKIAISTPTD